MARRQLPDPAAPATGERTHHPRPTQNRKPKKTTQGKTPQNKGHRTGKGAGGRAHGTARARAPTPRHAWRPGNKTRKGAPAPARRPTQTTADAPGTPRAAAARRGRARPAREKTLTAAKNAQNGCPTAGPGKAHHPHSAKATSDTRPQKRGPPQRPQERGRRAEGVPTRGAPEERRRGWVGGGARGEGGRDGSSG